MSDVIMASSREDAEALEAMEQHHAELLGGLTARVNAVVDATAAAEAIAARDDLVDWCGRELIPHAKAEEIALYPAGLGFAELRPLVEAMIAEHAILVDLVEQIRTASTPPRAAGAAYALLTLFGTHLVKENEQLLPVLAESARVQLAGLLGAMREELSREQLVGSAAVAEEGHAHSCSCGEEDGGEYPELDARVVPHAIRHATIFGALDAVGPGGGMVLVAPHDPLPLLAQLEGREPGAFEISYLERGPEAWRIQFIRRVSSTV